MRLTLSIFFLIFSFNSFTQERAIKNAVFPDEAWTGSPGVNFNIPKPGENRYKIAAPSRETPVANVNNNPSKINIGKTAAETADSIDKFFRSNLDSFNYSKITSFDAGPNGANLKRFLESPCYEKLGFDPSIKYSDLDEMYTKCEKEHRQNLIYKVLFISFFILFNCVVIFLSLGKKIIV